MSTLPDLDTANISFIAFWNAIEDGGVPAIDPEEAVSANGVESVDTYDNGWEGDYAIPGGRNARVRVKKDGWIVAYMGRDRNYGLAGSTETAASDFYGPFQVMGDWTTPATLASIEQNSLERAINNLWTALSVSADGTYSSQAVGLFNFEYPTATAITVFSDVSGTGDPGTASGSFMFTDPTTLHVVDAVANVSTDGGLSPDRHATVTFDTVTMIDTGSDAQYHRAFATVDGLGDMIVTDPETDYQLTANVVNQDASRGGNISALAVWE